MVTIKTNIGEVSEQLSQRLIKLTDKDYILRPLMFDLIDMMTQRIHVDGLASDESAIGTYQSNYLKYRERKHNRTSDSKIVVSLTRQLEGDWSVIATDNGYGIGFKNEFNYKKARWVEENKDKKIFDLSQTELSFAIEQITKLTEDALNS